MSTIHYLLVMDRHQNHLAPIDILVVDDTSTNLSVLTQLLSKEGYKVRVARNGEFALRSVLSSPPSLILLDIMMPEMNGYQVCERLKLNPKTQEIPVIFLSACDEIIDKVTAFGVGGVDYITKPFESIEVLVRIENQLRLRSLQQQLQRQNQHLCAEIEKRKAIEGSLAQSRSLLSGILNSSLDAIVALEAIRNEQAKIIDFRCLLLNPMAYQLLGKSHLEGKSLLQSLPGLQLDGLFDEFIWVVDTSQAIEKEIYYAHDGIEGWFEILLVKLGDGLTVTFREITKRKQIELALEKANLELSNQANLDGLTQIANRRYFDQYLAEQWQDLKDTQQPLALILADVDYFKLYNDNYGHQAGDRCLIQVARTLSRHLPTAESLAARYGGEEFGIILPHTSLEQAAQVGETIRQGIHKLRLDHAYSQVSSWVTLSLGISALIPGESQSPEMLIAQADRALYQAKGKGRDRLECIDISSSSQGIA
ncbi:diguanylate cyclase [Roseofilum sp. BLCC_M154]|uniref:Diguanylate cyclase n=1 Tax=Roseofilum acuticapitatum BLCC-M154 TaxID=3022444 RepID=A0ABT7AN45_9CYAN|nr:diguanylate cyclase [Roseofilum acuticapitatum]MDJ1168315.1 diguanylate cyclase [Roseofilum acuticapitatum BLCC-M154]